MIVPSTRTFRALFLTAVFASAMGLSWRSEPEAARSALSSAPTRAALIQSGMIAPGQFAVMAALPSGAAVRVVRASLRLEGRLLVAHWLAPARAAIQHRFIFDLARAHLPRFLSPAPYSVCLYDPMQTSACGRGVILLPVAVIHGVLGDLAVLTQPGNDPYPALLAALRRAGYSDSGGYRSLAYVTYPSATALLGLFDPTQRLIPMLFGDGVAAYAARYLAPDVRALLAASYAARVDLIGHSMGGLIARAYIASPANARLVRTAVLLAAPNQGSTVAFEVLGPRASLPSTGRDLLPTYPYLRDAGTGRFVAPPLVNRYLRRLNALPRPRGVRLISIYARDRATDTVLLVRGSRYQLVGTITTPGDGEVTTASARLTGAIELSIADGVEHAALPRDPHVQSLILGLLLPRQ